MSEVSYFGGSLRHYKEYFLCQNTKGNEDVLGFPGV